MANNAAISLDALQARVDALGAMVKEAYASKPDKDGAVRIKFASIREHARGIMDLVGEGDDTAEAPCEDEDMTAASNSPTKVAGLSMDQRLAFSDVISGRDPNARPTAFRDFIKPTRRVF